MAFLIIKSNDDMASRIIAKWYRGERREDLKTQFIRQLGSGIYLTDLTGEMLASVWALRKRYDDKIDIFISDLVLDNNIPEKLRMISEDLVNNPKSKKLFNKANRVKLSCTMNLKEKLLE